MEVLLPRKTVNRIDLEVQFESLMGQTKDLIPNSDEDLLVTSCSFVTALDGTWVRQVADLAKRKLEEEQGHSVTFTHLMLDLNQSRTYANFTQRMCRQIATGAIAYPDVLIDLTNSTASLLMLRRLSVQLDTGFISAHGTDFIEQTRTQSSTDANWTISGNPILSMGFPSHAPITAAKFFANKMHPLATCGAISFASEDIAYSRPHRNSEESTYIEHQSFSLSQNTTMEEYKNLCHGLFYDYHTHFWMFAISRSTMNRLVDAVESVFKGQPLNGSFVVYDTNINLTQCRPLCRVVVNDTDACETLKPSTFIYCVKLDLAEANQTTVNQIRQYLGKEWSSQTIRQIDALFDYETVFTAGLAMQNLTQTNQWPASPAVNLLCEADRGEEASALRYNLFRQKVTQDPPFVFKTATGWDGFCVEVVNILAQRLNLTVKFIEQPDGKYGSRFASGHWDGIIGSLVTKHAEVGIGPIIQTTEANEVVDFTQPYLPTSGISIVMRRTRENMVTPLFYVHVFTGYVWLVCGALILILGTSAWAFELISPYREPAPPGHQGFIDRLRLGRLFDLVSFATSSWASQGKHLNASY
ncbi:unnamed protein product [Echinostoma caproni]|uniref:Lig_chan-Glu_bd domain-containing protein n=1 Tax=Echinostoma caproni TaxID=27848 RepID=A0A183ACP0_9TREM|nr:unnamed protein product [Echinostoma caproni]